MSFIKKLQQSSTLNPYVFLPSIAFILAITIVCSVFPERSQIMLNHAKDLIFDYFSWFYVFTASVFIVFLLFLAFSRIGDIRLGADDEQPEFPFVSWLAMLFAAGMGIGLMYFGVAEPLSHYANPLSSGMDQPQTIKEASLYAFYHWGIHAWGIYAVIGLALTYFGFRYKLPLSVRSGFYPLLKNRINGPIGHGIDTVALCITVFGVCTTLGYGAMQMNAGLFSLNWVGENDFTSNAVLIVVVTALAVMSAMSGVGNGVRRLSEINLVVAVLLMLFVLVTGPTLFVLSGFTENVGYYFSKLVSLSFTNFAYEPEKAGWFRGWTVLYWAWWVSWAPFVGLFIARISRGRTIREFVLGVMFIPSMFNFLWMTVFGNSAIWIDINVANGALSSLVNTPDGLLFAFFQYLPFSTLLSIIAVVIISLFFITSADSSIYVMNSLASGGRGDSPPWQSMFWGILLVVLSLALLRSGGLPALQTMTLIIALPFMGIMLVLCYGMWKGFVVDNQYFRQDFNYGSAFWSGRHWKKQLKQILSQPQQEEAVSFINRIAFPALTALSKELTEYGLDVKVTKKESVPYETELLIKVDSICNFTYGIRIQKVAIHADLLDDDSVPTVENSHSYEPVTFFGDGRLGYDVQYMTKNEIITDVLKQYERYMSLVMDPSNQLMTQNVTKDQLAEEEALREEALQAVEAEAADVVSEAEAEWAQTGEADDAPSAAVDESQAEPVVAPVVDQFEVEIPAESAVAAEEADSKADKR
ncbi:MAG: BCCT family transporter [Neisseriaceae bacterium]